MERRTFVGASVAALGSAAVSRAADEPAAGELYELRAYSLKPAKQPLLDDYMSQALLPALKRAGVGLVGAFVEPAEKDVLHVHLLSVYRSGDQFAGMSARLAADAAYGKAAAAFLAAKADNAPYLRIESSLLAPIAGMPRLVSPDASKPRLMNLRVYESHNERSAAKKIEMFNRAELAIFKRVGLTPVFFAAAIAGPLMPNLTYLLAFPDEAGRQAAWDRFRVDAEWVKLRAMPEYADKEIVARITNKLLTPTPYSEI